MVTICKCLKDFGSPNNEVVETIYMSHREIHVLTIHISWSVLLYFCRLGVRLSRLSDTKFSYRGN